MKAVQHGHFYVQVRKCGTIYTNSNYKAWDAGWVPDAQWVTSLWRAEKINHDMYTQISARLKDGHDRRMSNLAVVKATEAALAQQQERSKAKEML